MIVPRIGDNSDNRSRRSATRSKVLAESVSVGKERTAECRIDNDDHRRVRPVAFVRETALQQGDAE